MSYHTDFSFRSDHCLNYDVDAFRAKFDKIDGFFVMNYNLRSFNSNFNDFSVFLEEIDLLPDILILTETWFMNNNVENIAGYDGFHSTRDSENSGSGGGVSIYILKSLNSKIYVEFTESSSEIETIHVKLKINHRFFNIVAIYRPPKNNLFNAFFAKLDSILDAISTNNTLILAGDINLNGLTDSVSLSLFMDIMKLHCLSPHIIIPTRPNSSDNNNSSQIDHIWSNFGTQSYAGVFNRVTITDHFPNFVILPAEISHGVTKITFRNHSENNISFLKDELSNFVLTFYANSPNLNFNGKFDLFYQTLIELYEKCCPLMTKSYSDDILPRPWIDNDIKLRIKRKHYLFQRYKNGAIPFEMYNSFKKTTEKSIRYAKQCYYKSKFDACAGDSSRTWKVTNSLLKTGVTTNVSHSICINGQLFDDEADICNKFNDYFSELASNLLQNIQSSNIYPIMYMSSRRENSFYFRHTDADEMSKLIRSFKNKKTSTDNLPIFILKEICPIIVSVLTDLFNESIDCGTFPDRLKLGKVIPLHKSGSRKDISNFRPITILSVISKVFEGLVQKRLQSFIKKYKIIDDNQFGFQKGKCTTDAILEFLENAYESLNSNQHLLTVYLDFSKAFDTISHTILLRKLDHMGFRGPINSWLESYLSGRKQFVSIGKFKSEIRESTMGVPQGSTLGPLAFILYIADMKNCLTSMKAIHYADDSTLYLNIDKNTDCTTMINSELHSLNSWLKANKLFLNTTKTRYMIIHNRSKPPNLNLKIENSPILRASSHKFLGIFIDETLKFDVHVNQLCSKISRNLGLIRRIKSFVPKNVVRQLHFSLIFSHITYGITSYGFASANCTKRLSNLLLKSIKLIINADILTPELYKRERLFDFNIAHKFFSVTKIFQIVNMDNHSFFLNKIDSVQNIHSYNTRSHNYELLSLPRRNFSKCQNSFMYKGIKFWNELPLSIRNAENIRSFRNEAKKFLLS